jgi:hypothetical protein
MNPRFGSLAPLAAAALLVSACASARPVLYPNEKLREVGPAAAQADVDACVAEAKQYVKTGQVERVAKSTAGGAVVGGATGAAVGAVVSSVGRGAGAGAAGGAAGGFTRGVLRSRQPDPVEAAYVDRCLAARGYDVLGWK